MSHERPVEPFSDLHVEEGGHVRAVLLHDPTVEGLDVALYLDGSGSMSDEYERKITTEGGGFWWDLFGWGKAPTTIEHPNQVEPPTRWILEYLASKDRNGSLRLAYWACGAQGKNIEVVGEVEAAGVKDRAFPGPQSFGKATCLTPVLRDFVSYMREQAVKGAKQGCAVVITDGVIHDVDELVKYARDIAKDIVKGRLPRLNFVLVGVGAQVDEEQLEHICHEEYPGVGHLWCHRVADEMKNTAELVAVLVDETMTVAAGGTITDDKGKVLKIYEGRLPAVLEFQVPEGCTSFTLEVNGQKYTQPLPDEDEHHDEEEEEEDHH